jgi:gliding motility-associated-like protein
MMNRLLGIIFLLFVSNTHAQNLIPNPGFELVRKIKKSNYAGSIEKAAPWFSPGTGGPALIQNNAGTFGPQKASDGNNYASLVLYDHERSGYREYLGVKLNKKLKAGQEYCVQFKVSAADESWAFTDELGVYLGRDSIAQNSWMPLMFTPNFKTRRYLPISDTVGWQHIAFTFIASGEEAFFYVGNFRADATTLLQPANRGAWSKTIRIYLDAFELKLCKPEIENSEVPVEPIRREPAEARAPVLPTMLTPNGDGFNDVFVIANLKRYSTLIIYSKKGEEVYRSSNYANDFEGNNLPEGKYSFELKTPEGNLIYGSFDLIRNGKRKTSEP